MIAELTNHLWQSTIFALAAGMLTVALRKNRAEVRYWLWFSASLKFFVPFPLLMHVGGYLKWAPTARKIATQIAPPAVTFTLAPFSQPVLDGFPPASNIFDWTPIAILIVWMCGFSAIAVMRLLMWRRIRAAVQASSPLRIDAMDIPARVEIRSSPGLLEPGVVGLLRPILLLPADISNRLTPRQLQAVLLHELCHIRRRDNLTGAIHMIVEVSFWFHPLVWWIGARLVEERERACDEEVLSLGSEPHDYAEGILNVCKLYVESPLTCVSGVTGANLKRRIEAIMTNRVSLRLTLTKKVVLSLLAVVAAGIPIVVGVVNTPTVDAQSSQAKSRAVAIPKWQAVSIRPDCGGAAQGIKKGTGRRPDPSPGRLSECTTVMDLIRSAYVFYADGNFHVGYVDRVPIEGGPSWINSDRFMINAKAEGPQKQEMMRGPMMQALLEDRFKLKIRHGTREGLVYALTVAKSGAKLQEFKGTCAPFPAVSPLAPGQEICDSRGERKANLMTMDIHGLELDGFSTLLFGMTDRPVIDKTGIAGRYNFHLEFTPDETTPGMLARFRQLSDGDANNNPTVTASDPTGPSIFTALQQQLGLKLESAKGPREFLSIDHVEKPSQN